MDMITALVTGGKTVGVRDEGLWRSSRREWTLSLSYIIHLHVCHMINK